MVDKSIAWVSEIVVVAVAECSDDPFRGFAATRDLPEVSVEGKPA